MPNKDKDVFSEQPSRNNDEELVRDKQPESYDTVLDEVTEYDENDDNVEAEYEGVSQEELEDEPLL